MAENQTRWFESTSPTPDSTPRNGPWSFILMAAAIFTQKAARSPDDEEETIVPAKMDRDVTLSADFANHIFSERA